MSTEALWSAVRMQAAAWAATPALSSFDRELPRNAPQRSDGLPGLLQRVQAGAGIVGAHPMRLASSLPMALSVMPESEQGELQQHVAWLEASSRVEGAHRLTIAWLRSRLPGYPRLPAPQLAPGTPLTTAEFTHRLIWAPGERAQGLQFRESPPQVADALGADEEQRRALDAANRAVAAAIARTSEWIRFADATAALDRGSRDALRHARKQIRDRLSPNSVDAYEPNLALRRGNYRDAVVAEEVAALSGPAAEYATAFATADTLIENAASDVFGQLTCYPLESLPCRDLEIQPADQTVVAFTIDDDGPTWPEPGMLAWLEDPLVSDAVQVTGVAFHWEGTGIATLNMTATLLRHTGAAWRATDRD